MTILYPGWYRLFLPTLHVNIYPFSFVLPTAAATFLDWAKAVPPKGMTSQSLRPLMR